MKQNNDEIQNRYRKILDNLFCSILVFDENGILVHCNSSAIDLFKRMGIDVEKEYHTPFCIFTDQLAEQIDIISGCGRHTIELDNISLICNVNPWMVDGTRCGTVIILHESMNPNCIMQELDVTSALLEELNVFVESSHDGILVTNCNGTIIRVNAAYEKAFSVLRKEIIGRRVNELVDEGLFAKSAALNVIETREPSTVVIEQKNKQLIETGTPVFNAAGEFTSVVVNIRDISELNKLQRKLENERKVSERYIHELMQLQNKSNTETALVFHSKEMMSIMDTINAISEVDSTILITGESGTGKEVIVNQIHRSGNRKDRPIIKINCGAIPAALFESEMFGYEEGAFTGARRKGKAGFFELANKGTLFLDEIGELNPDLQVKLLRVIQEGEVTRIGGSGIVHVDVRLLAATNRDLWSLVQEKKFRQDLYYRLNVINIEVPPLRKRRDDIVPLSLHFIERYNEKYGKQKRLSIELGKVLEELDWPGNIRELENLIENMVILVQHDVLYPEDLPLRYHQPAAEGTLPKVMVNGILPLKDAVYQVEHQLLMNAKERYSTTKDMAKALGVDQSTVSRKLNAHLHT